jgi:hypothetical protein
MRNNTLTRFLLAIALLILAIPVVASAQFYRDRYDRTDRRDVHDAIVRLDNSSARLEGDLNTGRERRVLGGLFWVRNADNNAVAEVRDFRQAVRELRRSSRGGFALENSVGEARMVLNRGIQLDRYLRLRTGSASVDADLADIRSNLHVIADTYGLSMPY